MNMKKIFLSISIISLILLVGCASSEEAQEASPQFRTGRTLESDTVSVVCTNCRAKFKISAKMQKLAMKGKAHIICPHCHNEIY